MQRFLEFIVEETLAGRANQLGEYSIALAVFDRDESFDPRLDTIVRNDARRLRQKLLEYYKQSGSEGGDQVVIDLPKGGYVPVFSLTSSPQPEPAVEEPVELRRRSGWSRAKALRPVLATVVLSVCVYGLWSLGVRNPAGSPTTPDPPPRVAVLPFEALPEGKESSMYSHAVSSALTAQLARFDRIEVIAQGHLAEHGKQSVSASAKARPLSEIVSKLGADYVIEGSVLKSDRQCQVIVRLVRTAGNRQVWAKTFDFLNKDIFQVQREVTRGVLSEVQSRLGLRQRPESGQMAAGGTKSVAAYEAYVTGYLAWVRCRRFPNLENFQAAEDRLQEALRLDPSYLEARTKLGNLYLFSSRPFGLRRKELKEKARDQLEKAHAQDPGNAEALYLLGDIYAYDGDLRRGLSMTRRALEIAPNDFFAQHHLGARYQQLGYYESAIFQYDEAIRLDRMWGAPYLYKSEALTELRRFKEARQLLRDVEVVAPGSPWLLYEVAHIEASDGRIVEAEEILRKSQKDWPFPESAQMIELPLGVVLAQKGDLAGARRIYEKHRPARPSEGDYPLDRDYVRLALLIGDLDGLVGLLRGSSSCGNYRWLVGNIGSERVKQNPRFQALVRESSEKWKRTLSELRAYLPVAPPSLPEPDDYLQAVR